MSKNKKNQNFYLIDIDGCITDGKNKNINLDFFIELTEQLKKIENYCLCTGRPAVYVESFAQFLSLDTWCICENGAYIYNTKTDEIIINELVNKNYIRELNKLKISIRELEDIGDFKFELGKELSISLNPTKSDVISLYNDIRLSRLDLQNFNIAYSSTAVDITPKGVNKKSGFEAVKNKFQFNKYKQIVGIGDSQGDIPFLNMCSLIGCPSNASDEIKNIANYISKSPSTKGVLDILQHFRS